MAKSLLILVVLLAGCGQSVKPKAKADADRRSYLDAYDDATAWGKIGGEPWALATGRTLPAGDAGHFKIELSGEAIDSPCSPEFSAKAVHLVEFSSNLTVAETVLDRRDEKTWVNLIDQSKTIKILYAKEGRVKIEHGAEDISSDSVSGRINVFSSRDDFTTGNFTAVQCCLDANAQPMTCEATGN